MKTILIYDQCGESPIRFAVLKGDYSRLNGIYVNRVGNDRVLEDELSNLIYDAQGKETLRFYSKFPYAAMKPDTKVIVAGFLP